MALQDSYVNNAGVAAGFIVIGDITSYVPNPYDSPSVAPSATIEVRRFINQAAAVATTMMWVLSTRYSVPMDVSLLGTMSLRKLGYAALMALPDFTGATAVIIPPVSAPSPGTTTPPTSGS